MRGWSVVVGAAELRRVLEAVCRRSSEACVDALAALGLSSEAAERLVSAGAAEVPPHLAEVLPGATCRVGSRTLKVLVPYEEPPLAFLYLAWRAFTGGGRLYPVRATGAGSFCEIGGVRIDVAELPWLSAVTAVGAVLSAATGSEDCASLMGDTILATRRNKPKSIHVAATVSTSSDLHVAAAIAAAVLEKLTGLTVHVHTPVMRDIYVSAAEAARNAKLPPPELPRHLCRELGCSREACRRLLAAGYAVEDSLLIVFQEADPELVEKLHASQRARCAQTEACRPRSRARGSHRTR